MGLHARVRICGHVALLFLVAVHVMLLLFACAHWNNWWSLTVWLPCVVAAAWPALTRNYSAEPAELLDTQCAHDTLVACREFSWALCAIVGVCAYLPPVLAWYNAGFSVHGALCVYGSVTALHWAYVVWLRVHVFP